MLTPGGWQRFDSDAGPPPGHATAATFLAGGEAWLRCRDGQANPELFGIDRWRGWWFIRNNVIRDFAALCKLELLPWDRWGAMTGGEEDSFIDQIARLRSDDSAGNERLGRFRHDTRLNPRGTLLSMDDDGRITGKRPSRTAGDDVAVPPKQPNRWQIHANPAQPSRPPRRPSPAT